MHYFDALTWFNKETNNCLDLTDDKTRLLQITRGYDLIFSCSRAMNTKFQQVVNEQLLKDSTLPSKLLLQDCQNDVDGGYHGDFKESTEAVDSNANSV